MADLKSTQVYDPTIPPAKPQKYLIQWIVKEKEHLGHHRLLWRMSHGDYVLCEGILYYAHDNTFAISLEPNFSFYEMCVSYKIIEEEGNTYAEMYQIADTIVDGPNGKIGDEVYVDDKGVKTPGVSRQYKEVGVIKIYRKEMKKAA